MPTIAHPNPLRSSAVDPLYAHRASKSPRGATMAQGRYYASSHDYAEINLQQIKANAMHFSTRESFDSFDSVPSRRPSNESRVSNYSQHTTPSPVSTTFSIPSRSGDTSVQRGSIFQRLPQTVYNTVLDQLSELHSDKLSPRCATCYMRDLVALQITSRSWDKAVRKTLYSKIHISDHDSPTQLKKYKMKYGSRLRLLRRTLRERRMLAGLVQELHVPDLAIAAVLPNGRPNHHFTQYRDLVASVIMVCPNLERFQGLYTFYSHEFDRLTHALSTRRHLKEHVWIISENEAITERSRHQAGPGLIDNHEVYEFMHYHSSWSKLETLMFCSPGGTGVLEHKLFVKVFQLLPRLSHLCVSSFHGEDFRDETLFALPALTSFRLEECPGVTQSGLSRWAATRPAQSLEFLSLIHQDLEGLGQISKILASLSRLVKFTIVQTAVSPSLPSDLMVFQPVIASPSLKHLHWEVASSGHFPTTKYHGELPPSSRNIPTANSHLAASIVHAGFPNLLTLRAPQDLDPPGVLQEVCRPTPNASILLPADRYGLPPGDQGDTRSMPASLPVNNTLHAARIRAQNYIDTASKSDKDFCKIIVTDHSDMGSSRHESSSTEYSASTDPTDPGDLCHDAEDPLLDTSADRPLSLMTPSSKAVSAAILSMLGASNSQGKKANHVCASAPPTAAKLHEYTFRPFIGRVSVSTTSHHASILNPPRFNLLPDVAEYDGDGGIIGWADLLRLKEQDDRAVNGPAWIKDGCTGGWNKGSAAGPKWWRHTERERRAVKTIGTRHFF